MRSRSTHRFHACIRPCFFRGPPCNWPATPVGWFRIGTPITLRPATGKNPSPCPTPVRTCWPRSPRIPGCRRRPARRRPPHGGYPPTGIWRTGPDRRLRGLCRNALRVRKCDDTVLDPVQIDPKRGWLVRTVVAFVGISGRSSRRFRCSGGHRERRHGVIP